MPDQPIFVNIIADYGTVDDMAFAEVRQAVRFVMRDKIAHMELSSVPAFDTVATGFFLAQIAINSHMADRQFFYVNTAPRKDDLRARENCAGEGLVYAKLTNGVQIVAVNSGHSLSFIKEHAVSIREIDIDAHGSQFRSRDIFPIALGEIAHGDFSRLREDIAKHIPNIPTDAVCYTDGYGNIKTSVLEEELKDLIGQKVAITINGQTHHAQVGSGIFAVADGDLILSAGSSGWTNPNGMRQRFVECVLRGGSAAAKFGKPKGGDKIAWAKV